MPEEKLVTVLTPLYNKAPFLKDYIEGLAKQTFLDKTKIIVTDNCSTDGSLEILKNYAEEYKVPIEFFQNDANMGIMYSIRKMYRKLDTKFFAVLDADDYYISPQKLEKAVTFLDSHEKYSAYACSNLFVFADGRKIPHFPNTARNTTYSGMKNTPFFQTASTTFRNNFTPQLLDEIDRITEGRRDHAFSGDAFRNLLAHHFGKFYFENSVDSAWRRDVGYWGTMPPLEQDLANMTSHWIYFDFLTSQFGVDENAQHCLNLAWQFYNKCVDGLMAQLKTLNIIKFEERPKFKENFENLIGEDGYIVANAIIDQCKKFNDIGLKVTVK